MSLIARALERRAFSSAVPSDPRAIPANGEQLGFNAAGESVTDQTALNLVAFYACVRVLADTVASLPWHAYRDPDGFGVKVDPQPTLLANPHPGETNDLTDFDFKHAMMVSLAMRGNFYGYVQRRDRLEYPTDVMPLHPDWVDRRRDKTMGGRLVTRLLGDVVPNADIMHVRGFTLPGSSEGMSPLSMARHAIGLGLAAQRFGGAWFRDGAAPSGQLVSDHPLTPAQATENQKMWIQSHGGRRLPAVLSGGMKYEPITITPEESQFLQTRAFSITEMAMLVGVPPYLIGDVQKSTSFGRGIEQQSIGFVTYNLRSWLTRIEKSMGLHIPRGQYVKLNVDALLRGDVKTRNEAHRIAIEGGWRNPDEVRALEDLPPIPDGKGQMFRQPMNFTELGTTPDDEGESEEDDDE